MVQQGRADRVAGGVVLAGLGVSAATLVLREALTTAQTAVTLLVGVVPGLALALVLVLSGVWLVRRGPPARETRRLLAWALAAGAAGTASTLLVVVYEGSRGVTVVDLPLVVTNAGAAFTAVGLLVGWYNLRARRQSVALTQYHDLVDNVPVAVFRATAAPDGVFVEANPAAVATFGAESRADIEGRPVDAVYVDPTDRKRLLGTLRTDGVVHERRVDLQRLDGEQFRGAVTAILHERDGRAYVDGVVEDVTERERYEQTLERRTQRLEVLNEVLRHDIRNDMSVVQVRGEQLAEGVDGELASVVESLLDRAEHVIRLTETAGELADVIRRDRAETDETVAIDRLLREVVTEARGTFPAATIDLGSVPATRVRGSELLASVFRNLVANAVRHHDATPTVEVRASHDESAEVVCVVVADDGPGIPDDRKDEIFQHGVKGTDSGGSGLGLYLVTTLVEQVGGAVSVADREPRGTVFEVELPVADDSEQESWLDEQAESGG